MWPFAAEKGIVCGQLDLFSLFQSAENITM